MEHTNRKCSFISFTTVCRLLPAALPPENWWEGCGLWLNLCSELRRAKRPRRTSPWFLNRWFTYVRTEVNYTEEVDDPVDSDGEQNRLRPASWVASNSSSLVSNFSLMPLHRRWSPGLWELGVQHLWLCPHAAGEQQVQEHGEESPAWTHLLRHPVHADHRGAGEDTVSPSWAQTGAAGECVHAFYYQNWLSAKCSLRSKCGRRTLSSSWRTRTMTLSRTRSGFLLRICWWWDPNPQLSVRPWSLKWVQEKHIMPESMQDDVKLHMYPIQAIQVSPLWKLFDLNVHISCEQFQPSQLILFL